MEKIEIGKELASVHHIIKRKIENGCQCESGKLSMANGHIIMYLRDHKDEDVFQRDFEEAFDITRSTASKIISLMEEKGLVERQAVVGDARLKKIILTEFGEAAGQKIIDDREALNEQMTQGFSEEELKQLAEYLQRIRANISR